MWAEWMKNYNLKLSKEEIEKIKNDTVEVVEQKKTLVLDFFL